MANFPNSVVRQLNEKVGEHPSVMDWGAVCDGIQDDSAAWTLAVNAVSSNSYGYLFVPGTSALQTVSVPSNVHIYGHPGKSGIVSTGTHSSSHGLLDFTGTNWSLSGLSIDGGVTTPVGLTYASFSSNPYVAALYDKTSIWIKPGAKRGKISNCQISHTGGYAILVDADSADVKNIKIIDNEFQDNRPHLFGTNTADLNYGSWTGGIWIRGDCRSSASKVFACRNITVTGNHFSRCTGEGVWMHSFGFDTHHTNVKINNNTFEDMGLDCIQIGNLYGGQVEGNDIHRAGYITVTDTSASVPAYLPGAFCAAIDSTGFAESITISGNTLTSVNGEFIDLDGLRKGQVDNNTCVIPDIGSVQYTEDSIAAYGTASANITKGIQTGNTSINGGAQDVAITNNRLVNCSALAISLAYGKRCLVKGNSIIHPATAVQPPIEIFGLATNGTEWQAFDNKVTENLINYPAANFCIFEGGDNASFAGCTNTIWNNHITGANSGEFLRTSSSASVCGAFFSSNDSTLSAQSLTALTRVGHGTSGAFQFYSYSGTSGPGYVAQISDKGPGINVGGGIGVGYVATGTRVAIGTLNDFASSGKVVADAFFVLAHDTYLDAEANSLPATSGLLRYTPGTGTASNTGNLEISTAVTTAGTRVWQSLTFGSATPPGADTQVVFNDAGAFGANSHFTFNKTLDQVTMNAGTSTIAALVVGTGFVQSTGGYLTASPAFNAFQATVGGFYGTSATLDQELYLKALSTATLLASPGGAYGALGYKSGSTYWYWNGSSFGTVDLSASASVPGSDKQVILNSSGAFFATPKLTMNYTTGQLTVTGTAGTAELIGASGYAQTAQGYLSNYTSYQTVNIPSGGVYCSSLRTVAYLALANASGDPSVPTSGDTIGNGVLYYNTSGNNLRVMVGGVFQNIPMGTIVNSLVAGSGIGLSGATGTVTISNTGVLSVQGVNGAVTLVGSTGVTVSGVFISIGQAVGTSNSPTFASMTLSGNLTASGFITASGNVNGGTGLATAGSVRCDASGNLINIASINCAGTITTAGAVVASIYDVQGGFFGQTPGAGLVCGTHTLFFKGGILYAFT